MNQPWTLAHPQKHLAVLLRGCISNKLHDHLRRQQSTVTVCLYTRGWLQQQSRVGNLISSLTVLALRCNYRHQVIVQMGHKPRFFIRLWSMCANLPLFSLCNFGTKQKKAGLWKHTLGKYRNPMSSFSSARLLQLIGEAWSDGSGEDRDVLHRTKNRRNIPNQQWSFHLVAFLRTILRRQRCSESTLAEAG